MNHRKLRKFAKLLNFDKEVQISFLWEDSDYFAFNYESGIVEISRFYHELDKSDVLIYLAHEIGHLNTIKEDYISDYRAEYLAHEWTLMRLEELEKNDLVNHYIKFLEEIRTLEVEDIIDLEYQEAANDIIELYINYEEEY